MEAVIPDKLYYKIGEVAAAASVKPSVLRFWETEFIFLNPQKSRTGQRLYSRRDLELILEIKRLLYREKLTIAGAKLKINYKLHNKDAGQQPASDEDVKKILIDVRKRLEHLRDIIAENGA